MTRPDFWDRREQAQSIIEQVRSARNVLDPFRRVQAMVDDLVVLLEFAESEGEGSESVREGGELLERLAPALDKLELASFLSGRMDGSSAVFSVSAGAGGTESCDWCSMLFRMYTHFMDRRGFTYEIVDMQAGDEAGLRGATLLVSGEFA